MVFWPFLSPDDDRGDGGMDGALPDATISADISWLGACHHLLLLSLTCIVASSSCYLLRQSGIEDGKITIALNQEVL